MQRISSRPGHTAPLKLMALTVMMVGGALAQSPPPYPAHPVEVILPYAAGGGADTAVAAQSTFAGAQSAYLTLWGLESVVVGVVCAGADEIAIVIPLYICNFVRREQF